MLGLHGYIHLRRLQSQIHNTLYAEYPPRSADEAWFQSMMDKVEEWRVQYPPISPIADLNGNWVQLEYHLTLCLLCRPCPGNARPHKAFLQTASKSSSQVVRTLKVMYRSDQINSRMCMFSPCVFARLNSQHSMVGYSSPFHEWNHIPQLLDLHG